MDQVTALINLLESLEILILGFGKEGKSTYQFIRNHLPDKRLTISDQQAFEVEDQFVESYIGEVDANFLNQFDLIIKSPGVSTKKWADQVPTEKISSQTDLFLRFWGAQTVGITGTKGKSSTSSLLHHILVHNQQKSLLGGNIGTPLFDIIPKIKKDTIIVAELSAHQLQYLSKAPHIGIILNLYQEHLDHFQDLTAYHSAKLNMALKQREGDFLIYHYDNQQLKERLAHSQHISTLLPYGEKSSEQLFGWIEGETISIRNENNIVENQPLKSLPGLAGKHNLYNLLAASLAASRLGISLEKSIEAAYSFKGLPHRIEFVATLEGVSYYNDSISTIPEATISALETLNFVETLILGGMDRSIDYTPLYQYLNRHPVKNIALMGDAGRRIYQEWGESASDIEKFLISNNLSDVVRFCKKETSTGKICLLSPAAASYGLFKNFEDRGDQFKMIILQND
ncbi:MAG TPA: UDP-N-acetylmuramoyl-L-alanine--D-glutamate ligase [Bacteroidales bacterium]|nr:UDP-N-acetylmuramoyl-L-alanine--D-glutamate ligase [Bacteroidales bacterium]HOH21747.1 UDP-N-acetylmuramoyl-L-alanine--D-glutamate ligase [Bacteroidales bacterium]HPB58208.1 UDP-N-acetylmuramoyl-L-alanine--D-glutamate ligase [Bacteroidales bacterium]HPZ02886.1 UDP-N-acetylmuramoyl-L-alanine--D-glutamate ligase [Bacteroidales bacterium]HQB74232.1 UDP-N-acetylmuramoyl-L-alanine--D-glutamate ligase [Bacteroidales bacterium]